MADWWERMLKHAYQGITALASALPRCCQYVIAHRIAELNYLLDHAARRNVQRNLRVVLGPDAPESAVRKEARWVFRSFGMYLCEFFGHRRFGPKYIDEQVVVQGREHLDAALRKGRGALFCSAHYSNWELGATVVAHLGYPITAVVQMHSDPKVNALFVGQREAKGIRVVPTQQGAIAALKALRRNQTVALLGDRTTGGPVVPVELCGRKTFLPQGPWRIALASGAVLLPTFVYRRLNYSYTLEFEPPIDPLCLSPLSRGRELDEPARSGSRNARLAAMAQAWARRLEARLRTDPSQWATFFDFWDEARVASHSRLALNAEDQSEQMPAYDAGAEGRA